MAWYDDQFKGFEASAAQRAEDQKAQLHRAEVLKAKAPVFFQECEAAIREAVTAHNARFSGADRQIRVERAPRGEVLIQATKGRTIRVELDPSCQLIRIQREGGGLPNSIVSLGIKPDDSLFTEKVNGADGVARESLQFLFSELAIQS